METDFTELNGNKAESCNYFYYFQRRREKLNLSVYKGKMKLLQALIPVVNNIGVANAEKNLISESHLIVPCARAKTHLCKCGEKYNYMEKRKINLTKTKTVLLFTQKFLISETSRFYQCQINKMGLKSNTLLQ